MDDRLRRVRLNRNLHLVLYALKEIPNLPSAQEVHFWLKQKEPDAPGLTTIYRAIDSLLELGVIQCVVLGDGEKRYEPIEPGSHHHHLICEKCHASVHMDQCFLDQFTESVRSRHGFTTTRHVLEIFGICRNCSLRGRM